MQLIVKLLKLNGKKCAKNGLYWCDKSAHCCYQIGDIKNQIKDWLIYVRSSGMNWIGFYLIFVREKKFVVHYKIWVALIDWPD